MRTDVSTPFDNQPEFSSLYASLVDLATASGDNTVICKTPLMIDIDGSVYTDEIGDVGISTQVMHHTDHDLWDELLWILHGLATNRYSPHELSNLKDRSVLLKQIVAQFCTSGIAHMRGDDQLN